MKKIIITIENGITTVETSGYRGKGCDAVHKAFEQVHGGTVSTKLKPEHDAILTTRNVSQGS